MYFLLNKITPIVGFHDAVKSWIGPLQKKQDFAIQKIAFELKTSMTGDSTLIKISSLDQLDNSNNNLFLVHNHICKSISNGGDSLELMFNKASEMFEGNAETESDFFKKIKQLYGKATDAQLKETYDFVGMEIYEITNKFPCLTRKNVPNGVSNAKYSINPAHISSFEFNGDIKELL